MHKLFFVRIVLAFSLIFTAADLKAQDGQIKQIANFPTKEIYDLHIDRHGFLWIASDFGVARYDGVNYTHFSHPRQISLGCTNLLEDSYGRIWFNNFNGQIFYIDHETVTLLDSYHYKTEHNFPRMALFKKQLLATSDKGLFVLNTENLKGKYIGDSVYTSSLAVLKSRVLVRGDRAWFAYNGADQLKKITYAGDEELKGNVYLLVKDTYRDTAYLMANPTGVVKKMLLQNDTVKQAGQIVFNNFINTISIQSDNQWVNTNSYSYSLKTGEKIKGYNLSDIVTDHEGNKWFSSLYYGLLTRYKNDIADETKVPNLDADDLVVSLKNYQGKLLLGTQKGYLILFDPVAKSIGFKIKISTAAEPINYIAPIGKDDYIIACSIRSYRVNIPTKKVTELVNIKTVKQLSYDDKATYIASTSGLFVIPHQKSDQLNRQIMNAFGRVFKYNAADNLLYLRLRSRTIAYYPEQAALFVSIKNSLFKIDKSGMKPFLYDNEQVYAASLAYVNHRLYIGTISNGMLVVENNGIKHISVQNGLFSKSIFKIKPVGENLWILGSGPLQIFNTQTQTLVDNYEFPDRSASEVLDIDGIGQKIYLASSSGLDNFPMIKTTVDKKLKNYLLYVKVNNQIPAADSGHKLSYAENNVLFNIGIPAYLKAREIYIKYCLATKTDTTWLTTEPGERTIHFSSLMPGTYTFKAIAVDPRLGMADTMIRYDFTIEEPWWRSATFKVACFVILLLLIFYGYVMMLHKRLSLKKAFDAQQQLILAERQRISSEMHDDIGSGVFAIHRLADAAGKHENAPEEIGQIKTMVIDLSDKIREVIWSTNVGNDNLEHLIYYTCAQIEKLLQHSDIKLVLELPDDIADLKITVLSRRNVYLLVKEMVHNAIKHSKATTLKLKMLTEDRTLFISVEDNGVGINPANGKSKGMGLGNIRSRVEKFKGKLNIENDNGTHIHIEIPFSALQVIEFDKKLNKWQMFITNLLTFSSDNQQEK